MCNIDELACNDEVRCNRHAHNPSGISEQEKSVKFVTLAVCPWSAIATEAIARVKDKLSATNDKLLIDISAYYTQC